MIVDYLHSYYTMPARLWVGGVERIVTLRWFRAPAGAKKLPFPTCFFTHVDDKVWERNPGEPGELNRSRIHDQGRNNGYQGQCYLGDPQWFLTGQLPASVVNPSPPSACLCQILPAQAAGAVVLSGSAAACQMIPATDACAQCPGGYSAVFKVASGGGTGAFAQYNGEIRVVHLLQCTWFYSCFGRMDTMRYEPLEGRWSFNFNGGTNPYANYRSSSFDCRLGGTFTLLSYFGNGTPAASVTITPS